LIEEVVKKQKFDRIKPKAIELYEKLRKESEINAKGLVAQTKEHLSKIDVYSTGVTKIKDKTDQLIKHAEDFIKKYTYFSYLDANQYLNKAIENLLLLEKKYLGSP
jgi:hypothetical protein